MLNSDHVPPPMIREAIRRVSRHGADGSKEIVESTAVDSLELDGKFWLAKTFNRSPEDLGIAVCLWEKILDTGDLPASLRDNAKHHLGLSYMGLGRCSDAARMFRSEGQSIDELSIADAFNFGMAMWGANRTVENGDVSTDR